MKPFNIAPGATVRPDGRLYELDLPNLGYRENFSSMEELSKFMKQDMYEKLRHIATAKGFILDRFDGKFFITSVRVQGVKSGQPERWMKLQTSFRTRPSFLSGHLS